MMLVGLVKFKRPLLDQEFQILQIPRPYHPEALKVVLCAIHLPRFPFCSHLLEYMGKVVSAASPLIERQMKVAIKKG